MSRSYTAVVFDFDGTLVNSNQLKRDLFFELASVHPDGENAMRSVYSKVKGNRYEIWRAWANKLGSDGEFAKAMTRRYNFLCDRSVELAPEIPGATILLETLFYVY